MEIPVITTRATGCCDSIIDNKTGVFVTHSEQDLETVLIKLFENPELREQLGICGRKFVEENFRQELVWKEIEKQFN